MIVAIVMVIKLNAEYTHVHTCMTKVMTTHTNIRTTHILANIVMLISWLRMRRRLPLMILSGDTQASPRRSGDTARMLGGSSIGDLQEGGSENWARSPNGGVPEI